MILSIADSIRRTDRKDLDFSYEAPDIESLEEGTVFKTPVHVKGTVIVQARKLDLDVNVRTVLQLPCTRCLDEITQDIELDIRETWAKDVAEDDLDTYPLSEDDTVDLTDLLTKDIISSLPIQSVCSDHCKGLCQGFGANLNREACDCDKEQVDERFAALKDLFKEV